MNRTQRKKKVSALSRDRLHLVSLGGHAGGAVRAVFAACCVDSHHILAALARRVPYGAHTSWRAYMYSVEPGMQMEASVAAAIGTQRYILSTAEADD